MSVCVCASAGAQMSWTGVEVKGQLLESALSFHHGFRNRLHLAGRHGQRLYELDHLTDSIYCFCFCMSLCVVCMCMCMCTYACMHAEGQGCSQSLPLSLWTLFAETEQLSWTQHRGTGVFYPTSRIHTEIPRFTNGKRPVSRSHRKVGSVPGLANSGCILEFTTAQHPKYNETWCPTIEEWVKKTDTGIFSTIKKDEGQQKKKYNLSILSKWGQCQKDQYCTFSLPDGS